MKKIVLGLTLVIAIFLIAFTSFKIINYYNKRIDDNKLKASEESIKIINNKIEEKKKEEESIRNNNKDKIEENESWKAKRKEIEKNL